MLDRRALSLSVGDPLPALWHWFYFLPRAPQMLLDVDGHPQRGGFLPPIPLPRRMFAGAQLSFRQPLRIGVPATRRGEIVRIEHKNGRSGPLAFVTVSYRIEQDGVLCIEERQDIVYREPGLPIPMPALHPFPALPAGATARLLRPDTRLLFRFSALTYNAHRIHYDRAYALHEEGYPALVVHGPLSAVLLADLVEQTMQIAMHTFHFKGVKPLFDERPMRLVAMPNDSGIALEAQACDGSVAIEASATC